ncbi:MAG: diguanylate cyclase [Campylobacterota bacterium]|nr:diguanylate cyclase [Campylobacterota bacterium]
MKKSYYGLVFILLVIAVYFYLKYERTSKQKEYLLTITKQYTQDYNVLYDQYKTISNIIFETKINKQEVKSIFKDALIDSKEKKDKTRKKLYLYLQTTYGLLQKYNIKQLHFHLKNNESFLRFHKPERFGDDLSEVRATVKYVNEHKKPIDGFEEGRIYNGYRFVYPLFFEDEYLGSVEVSFSTLAMNIELMENFNVVGKFLILKEIVDKKVFEKERSNYSSSQFKDFYFEKKIEDALEKYNTKKITLSVSDKTKSIIEKKVKDKKSFSVYDEKSNSIMTFIKIQNPLTNDVVGMYVLRSESTYIMALMKNCMRLFGGTVLFLIVVMFFVYRVRNDKIRLSMLVKKKTKELRKSKRKMEEYIRLVDENIITSSTDLNGRITYASEAFSKVSGYTKDELIGTCHNIIRSPDMPDTLFESMWSTIEDNKTWQGEIKNIKKDGTPYWVEASISPNYNEEGEKIGYTAIRQDITDKKIIEDISITDGLTNIFNRRHFNNIFPKIINSAKRHNELVSFIILDIDYFKQYNDTYGHQKGDEVLKSVANTIQSTLKRADDYCFRLGGEEFGVIFKVEKYEQSVMFANTIRSNIEALYIEHNQNSASSYITASVGLICKSAKDIKNMDEVYNDSDKLLYQAKNNGRNRVVSNN